MENDDQPNFVDPSENNGFPDVGPVPDPSPPEPSPPEPSPVVVDPSQPQPQPQPEPSPSPPDVPTPPPPVAFSTFSSYYDEGMFMCEPCYGHGGSNQCMFSAPDNDGSSDWTSSDPHSDHSWTPNYNPNSIQNYENDPYVVEPSKFSSSSSALRSNYKPGDVFPACGNNELSSCYFQESGQGLVDACMAAVFDPISSNFTVSSAAPRRALALAQAREAACSQFVCNTKSLRAGNGKMTFDASECSCYNPPNLRGGNSTAAASLAARGGYYPRYQQQHHSTFY